MRYLILLLGFLQYTEIFATDYRREWTYPSKLVLPEQKTYKLDTVKQFVDSNLDEISEIGREESLIICKALSNDFNAVLSYAQENVKARSLILKSINSQVPFLEISQIANSRRMCRGETTEICLAFIDKAEIIYQKNLTEQKNAQVSAKIKPSPDCSIPDLMKTLKSNAKKLFFLHDEGDTPQFLDGCNWDDIYRAIEKGNYQLFELVRPEADGHMGESIEISMEMSIFFVPEKALARGYCIPSGIIEPTEPDWIELLEAGLKKVESIKNPKLQKLKNACLKKFQKSIRQAKDQYQKLCVLKSETDSYSGGCHKTDDYEDYVHTTNP